MESQHGKKRENRKTKGCKFVTNEMVGFKNG